jgi:hypothetical protein
MVGQFLIGGLNFILANTRKPETKNHPKQVDNFRFVIWITGTPSMISVLQNTGKKEIETLRHFPDVWKNGLYIEEARQSTLRIALFNSNTSTDGKITAGNNSRAHGVEPLKPS